MKAFAIISVVVNHVELFGMKIDIWQNAIGATIYSYFMPVFFFVSGFMGYKSHESYTCTKVLNQLFRKFKLLIVPTFVFYVFYCIYSHKSPLSYFSEGFQGYWFCLTLFESYLVFISFSGLAKFLNLSRKWIFGLVAMGLGLYLCSTIKLDALFYKMLEIEKFTFHFQFFAIGLLCGCYKEKTLEFINNEYMLFLGYSAYILCMTLIFQNSTSEDIRVKYGIIAYIAFFASYYLGTFVVFTYFYRNQDWFDRDGKIQRVISFIGKRTLDIYLIHYFFLPKLPVFKHYFCDNQNVAIEFTVSCGIAMVIVALSLGISSVIRNSKYLGNIALGAK